MSNVFAVLLLILAHPAAASFSISSPTNYPVGTGPRAVAIGDFNGDGKLDLAVVNQSSNDVSILLGNGDGTFQQAIGYDDGFPKHSKFAILRDGR